MQEHLNRMRNAWVDRLAVQVCRELRPEICNSSLFAPWVENDPLTLAAVLARIAAEDIKGSSPRIISEHLRSAGIVVSEASVPLVANGLVMPVVRTVRGNGVPWERWWDVRGLSELLVELWTGRRLSTNSRERVRHELTALWRAPSQLLEIILENAENPFTCLPSDFLSESTTGVARNFMHAFVRLGKVKVVFGEDVLRCWPQLADRPDLAQIVQRWCRRNDLERVSRRVCVPLEVDGFRIDLDTWDARLRQLLSRLSAYEQTLMMPSTDDDRYSEKCLLAGQGLQQSRLLGDNDLLWDSKFGVQGTSVPEWMVEEIVTCGTRFFHTQVGPHPVWLATAETDLHLAAMQALMGPDTQGGFEVENYSDGLRLWLHFPVPSGDPGPAFQVPYTYSLSWVKHAWELLHLATVGYARLAIVQLIGDGELRAVGSMWLPLPDEVCARCKEAAVRALRRLVGDETQLIIQRATTEGRGQAAEAAFWSAENAKGEDIHDEVALVSNFDEYKHFMSAARYLGHVRAQYAASLLDRGVEGADVRMQLAEEERLRTLELLRGALDAKKEEAGASGILQTFPLSRQTLFVHLINRFGRLQLAAGWGGSDCMNCHLFSCAELSLDYLAEAIREWVRRPPECQGHVWPDHLQRLLGACTELAQSITEITAGYQFRRLVLSPTPPMELLPLHAVPLDTVHSVTLSDVFDHVAYAPTARLVSAIQRSERRQAEVEVLVVPHSGAGIPGIDPIGGPIIEAHVIATLRGGAKVLREEEATPARALQEMSKARIVHVASHGLTHPNRWAAGLALQGKTLGQATLTTSRILADGTFSSVDLVILNACRTGTHESTTLAVQTLRSLESAFLARGARAVISTLWEITDLQGLVFSAVLHAHLGVGVDPHTAYSDTIRYLRTHQWRVVSRCEAVVSAESIISVNLPGWRSYLDQQASENPLFWAAFKITGSA